MPPQIYAAASVGFIDPTKADGHIQSENHTYINTSITGTGDMTSFIDWSHSLIGWWRFNEESGTTVTDYSAYGNDGTMVNMNSGLDNCAGGCSGRTADGKFGNGMVFDGIDDDVDIGNAPRPTGTQTIELFYRMDMKIADITEHMTLIGGDSFSSGIDRGHAIGIPIGSKLLYSDIYSGDPYGNHRNSITFDPPDDGEWHHLVSTYDSENNIHRFCLDTICKVETPNFLTYKIDWGTTPLKIGKSGTYSFYFNGTIDEVRIWNRALTEEEIKSSYNAGLYRLGTNFTDLADGTYEYTAYVQGSDGNIDSTETRTITIDSSYVGSPADIEFIYPTEDDGETIYVDHTYINTSITGSGDMTSFIDWNRSLIGWWRFEGDYLDDSSYSNDAVQSTASRQPLSVSGKFGSALDFDGIDDYLDLSAHSNDPEFNTPTGSIELWFNPVADNHYSQLFNFRKVSVQTFIIIREYRESYVRFVAEIGDVTQFIIDTPAGSIQAGDWNYLVFQQNGSGLEVYINGDLQELDDYGIGSGIESTMWLKDTFPADADITLGHMGSWSDGGINCYYHGSLDEYRIWSRPLSPDEIKASYNAGLYRLGTNFTELADGTYEYTAYVQDSAGNIEMTETRTINISSVAPSSPPIYSVNGTVYDTIGNILVGAEVKIPSVGITTTDGFGFYKFVGLVSGNYNIVGDMVDYQVNTSSPMTIDHNITYDIILEASSKSFVGVVTNAAHVPLDGVHVVAVHGTETYDTYTNPSGQYILVVDNVASKEYNISASKSGYVTGIYYDLTASSSGEVVDFILGSSFSFSTSQFVVVQIDPENRGVVPTLGLGTTQLIPIFLKNPTDDYIVVPLHVGSTEDEFRYLMRLKTGDYRPNDVNITLAPHEERYVMVEIIAGRKGTFNITIGPDDDISNKYDTRKVTIAGEGGSLFSGSPGLGLSSFFVVLMISIILISFLPKYKKSKRTAKIR